MYIALGCDIEFLQNILQIKENRIENAEGTEQGVRPLHVQEVLPPGQPGKSRTSLHRDISHPTHFCFLPFVFWFAAWLRIGN